MSSTFTLVFFLEDMMIYNVGRVWDMEACRKNGRKEE